MMTSAMMKTCRMQVFSLILVVLIVLPARAEVIPGRWEKVSELDLGTPIAVELKNGDQVIGDLEGLFASELDVETGSVRAVIPKTDVRTITTRKMDGVGEKAKKGAQIGAAVGLGVPLFGIAKSGAGDLNLAGVALVVLMTAGVGTAIGAGLGAVAGIGTKREEMVVYRATEIP